MRDDPHMGMRVDESAGRILDRLYELRDRDAIPDLQEEARGAGVKGVRAAAKAVQLLEELGLLTDSNSGRGRLSALGVRLFERFGGGKAVLRRLLGEDLGSRVGETHYHGPVFLGDVGQSNVAFAGEGVTQSIALAGPTRGLIDELVRSLRRDASIPEEKRSDAVGDARSIQAELEKPSPNWKVVGYLLLGLGAIASAAEQVRKLKSALGLP